MAPGGQRSALAGVVLSTVSTVVAVLPVFLAGALGSELSSDLAFTAAGLGAAIAGFRLGAAATARYLGRLTDRLGAVVSMRAGMGVTALACTGIATIANRWSLLLVLMILAGTGQAMTQPAANRMLLSQVPSNRQGIAFGIKQSAPPAASMLAGISLPAVALTVGWRWAYLTVPVLAGLVVVAIGRRRGRAGSRVSRPTRGGTENLPPPLTVAIIMAAFALGNAASSTIPAFFVTSAVHAGTAAELTGTVLAVGSVFAIAVRIVTGVAADRMISGHFRVVAALLAAGSTGFFLLALGVEAPMFAGVMIGLAGTWGFHGIFWYSLMRAYPGSPGAVTGAVSPGGLVGGMVGPIGFGLLADGLSYRVAWNVMGTLAVAAAFAMLLAARRIDVPSAGA